MKKEKILLLLQKLTAHGYISGRTVTTKPPELLKLLDTTGNTQPSTYISKVIFYTSRTLQSALVDSS